MSSIYFERVIPMLWATRHNARIDRCSTAWLIKRSIDKKTQFSADRKLAYAHALFDVGISGSKYPWHIETEEG